MYDYHLKRSHLKSLGNIVDTSNFVNNSLFKIMIIGSVMTPQAESSMGDF